jgi:hypothetical protein
MCRGVPGCSGAAQGRVSPSAAAGRSRPTVTVTSVPRSRLICASPVCDPFLTRSRVRMNASLGPWRMVTMSSMPSSSWAGGATLIPAPKYAALATTTA